MAATMAVVDSCCGDGGEAADDALCPVINCVDLVALQMYEDIEGCSCTEVAAGLEAVSADPALAAGAAMVLPTILPLSGAVSSCCAEGDNANDNAAFNTCLSTYSDTGMTSTGATEAGGTGATEAGIGDTIKDVVGDVIPLVEDVTSTGSTEAAATTTEATDAPAGSNSGSITASVLAFSMAMVSVVIIM